MLEDKMTQTIIGHVAPDWDCIGAIWLLKKFGGLENADVMFVNTGAPDPALLEHATAVVDTGRLYDPSRLCFDHHHLIGAAANETCATRQVAQYLVLARPDYDFNPIWPIIDLIYAGDTGKRAANESRQLGIHALLANKKRQGADNYALLAYGFDLLDSLSQSLISQDEARRSLEAHTIYRSEDGLVVALLNAPHGATFAAHEAGARLVVFGNYDKNAIGVMRGGEGADVHAGALVENILDKAPRVFLAQTLWAYTPDVDAMFAELATWYRHQAGFFAGRGTDKAPSDKPILVELRTVAAAIDWAWVR